MEPRFRKRPDLHVVVLPEVGRVVPGQVLEGAEYARYCPQLLERLPDVQPAPKSPAPSGRKNSTKVLVQTPEASVSIDDDGLHLTSDKSDITFSVDDGMQIEEKTPSSPPASPISPETDATADEESAKLQKRAEVRRKRG